jgi:hypothetical protein
MTEKRVPTAPRKRLIIPDARPRFRPRSWNVSAFVIFQIRFAMTDRQPGAMLSETSKEL